jgi:hypothetical protein
MLKIDSMIHPSVRKALMGFFFISSTAWIFGCTVGSDEWDVVEPPTEAVLTPQASSEPLGKVTTDLEDQNTPVATIAATEIPTESQDLPTPTPEVPLDEMTGFSPIIVDHHSIPLFDSIPEEYIQAAADLNMIFMDRSVGENIDQGLTCLSYPSSSSSPIGCRRVEHKVPAFNVAPSELFWSRAGGYDRSNWEFRFWAQPGCGEWYGKVGCFLETMESEIELYDVVSFQLSYLAVGSGSSITDQPGGFFSDNPDRMDVYDQEAFENKHPETVFIYWTTSLAREIGSKESEVFNQQMRDYAKANSKILFDVADILSHDPSGNPCFDNRDGVPYSDGNKSENLPDDGLDIPAICQHYTTEVRGGHLGSISAGKIRVAKAFWILMAQIAGWEPDV